jgi:hypothetical protein
VAGADRSNYGVKPYELSKDDRLERIGTGIEFPHSKGSDGVVRKTAWPHFGEKRWVLDL